MIELHQLTELLQRLQLTVSCAESLTGGELAAKLTAPAGASNWFLGGVVAYAAANKISLLGVPSKIISEHGVVSAQVAAAMAAGVRQRTRSDFGLSTTGVAGPEPVAQHPVGTVFVGIAGPGVLKTIKLQESGTRAEIRAAVVQQVISGLWHELN